MIGKRPQDWSAEEKQQVVIETASINEEDLGAFLRCQSWTTYRAMCRPPIRFGWVRV